MMQGRRAGLTLAELLVGLVVASLLATSLVKLATDQSRLVMTDEGRGEARSVSRGALTLLASDVRMVEISQGAVHLHRDSVTLRVPYAIGIICAASSTEIRAALMPVDSMIWDEAGRTGFAWRDAAGVYQYTDASLTLSGASSSDCTGNPPNITPIPGGRLVTIQPGSASAVATAPIMLYQHVRYAFKASQLEPGTIGLWRSVLTSPIREEELAAPFDASARFRFYVDGNPVAQTGPPALHELRGIQVQLTAYNRRAGVVAAAERTPLVTSIFFRNR